MLKIEHDNPNPRTGNQWTNGYILTYLRSFSCQVILRCQVTESNDRPLSCVNFRQPQKLLLIRFNLPLYFRWNSFRWDATTQWNESIGEDLYFPLYQKNSSQWNCIVWIKTTTTRPNDWTQPKATNESSTQGKHPATGVGLKLTSKQNVSN